MYDSYVYGAIAAERQERFTRNAERYRLVRLARAGRARRKGNSAISE